jgi:uncharacterized protein
MWPFLPATKSLEALTVVSATGFVFLGALAPGVWKRERRVRRGYAAVVTLLAAAHGAWCIGDACPPLSYRGAAVASLGLVLFAMVVASLPLAVLLRRLADSASLSSSGPVSASEPEVSIGRRTFVHAVTLIAPTVALASGLDGILSADDTARIPRIAVRYGSLPSGLDGLSILQLSDLHLGASKGLADLENLLSRFDSLATRPDLVVFTGDVADDLGQVTDALNAACELHPKYGVFACLGNHEYLHDIGRTRPLYDRSRVPLLVDEGVLITVPGTRLWLAGVDDPITLNRNIEYPLRASVRRALEKAPSDAFRVLLSHRPEAFDPAATLGVDLTLSGHTHGGQIGFNGKSAFQPLYDDGYLWGSYARGPSRLYTTSGFGHWFPFRLGCPTEAPVLVLTT